MKKPTFETFLRERGDLVFGYAFYFLGNREDAEDVTQEVFLKLWQHWSRIASNGRVGFAMRTAHNKCVDLARRRKTSGYHMRERGRVDLESVPADRDSNVDPELHLEFTETQEVILEALGRLPERTRGILLMHYFKGFKLESIGEILGMKVPTVKVTLHRGRLLLRRTLAERFRGGLTGDSDEKTMQ